MKKTLYNIATVLAAILILVLMCLAAWQLDSINTTYDVGQTVQLKLGGSGMILSNGTLSGYLVRVGHEEIWYKEFELEEL